MPKRSALSWLLIGLCLLALLLIRRYESAWFYDPFLRYFQYDYLHVAYPDVNLLPLLSNYALRYTLNSLLSVALLRLWFGASSYLPIIQTTYWVLGIVLLLLLMLLLTVFPENPMLLFYVRRFIIQPIPLLLCAGALFYFQWQSTAEKS